MMVLANPIYDTIFKYLLEDIELARELISKIMGETIVELTPRPNEITDKSKKYEVLIMRMDFAAVILTQEGEHKKVLIELQKAQQLEDIMRFRKYLGHNYAKADSTDGKTETVNGLPIVTIYFLGFRLKSIDTPILKVNRTYLDLLTNQPIQAKEEFVEKLAHDSYIIQIPRLRREVRTELESVLKIFNQSYISGIRTQLTVPKEDVEEGSALLQKMVDRLRRAATDTDVLRELELEEDFEKILDHAHRKAMLSEEKAILAQEDLERGMKQFKEGLDEAQEEVRQAQEELRKVEEDAQRKKAAMEQRLQELEAKYNALLNKKDKK
jgi:hypothetical protein